MAAHEQPCGADAGGGTDSAAQRDRVWKVDGTATLTGSGAAGRAVARKAGLLLKKTVLELGGSDPYLVLEDDWGAAAALCPRGRLMNAGQSCIAAKRLIVVDEIHDRFVEQFVKHMAATKMGDPLRLDTEMGPLSRQDLRDKLHRQVEGSIANRARCVLGGQHSVRPRQLLPAHRSNECQEGHACL